MFLLILLVALYVSMGGRDQEMTFGIGRIDYSTLYTATAQTIAAATSTSDGPNKDADFNLAHLPSDAVVIKDMGKAASTGIDGSCSWYKNSFKDVYHNNGD